MLRRLGAGAACLFILTHGWGMDDASQKLADRYFTVLAANPSQTVAFDRLWQIYADQGETARLLILARGWAKEHPVLAARFLRKGGQKSEASAALETLSRKDYPAAELLVSWIEQDQGPGKAAMALESWHRGDADSYILLGELWSRAGQSEKARSAWQQAVSLSPRDVALRNRLAEASIKAGDAEEALSHWRAAADQGAPAQRLEALEKVVEHSRQVKHWNQAIEAQERLIDMLGAGHWKLAEARTRLIDLYAGAGRLGELEARWTKDADQSNDTMAMQRLIELYAYRQDDVARLRWLRKAAELSPRDVELWRQLAQGELAAGNLPAASSAAERLQTLRPGDTDTVFLQAELAALNGEEGRAASLLGKLSGTDESMRARVQEFYDRMHLHGPQEQLLKAAIDATPGDLENILALAQFYLRQKRFADAVEVVDHYSVEGLPSKEAGGNAFRVARVLQEARLEEAALRWSQRAWAKDPTPETALATAELLDSLDRRAEALALVAEAARTKTPPAEEVDRRLFAALQTYQPKDELVKGDLVLTREIIGEFQKAAFDGTSDQPWRRLVRWRQWNDERIAAEESCRAGLRLYPQSQALQGTLAELLLADGGTDAGIEALRVLAALAPDREWEIEKRIGHLELDRGKSGEAERIFRGIWRARSADWSAGADVAMAQQAGGDWFEALETWMEIWKLAPAEGRRTIRSSILGAVARLQLWPRGLTFLEEAAAQERDSAARSELLREAAAFAQEQNVLEDWKSILRKRLAAAGAAPYWREGLAWALREQGMFAEASEMLSAGDQADRPEAVDFLLKTAEQQGDFTEAARLAGKLARQSQTAAAWMRYAILQERSGQGDAARATWNMLVARMNRDPDVLLAAADFFQRQGEREPAEKYRRSVGKLEALSPSILLRLGRASLARADRDQAATDFENLLASTRADASAYGDCLPWPLPEAPVPNVTLGRGARTGVPPRRGEWSRPSEADTEGCRLLAIKELGRLLANSPQKAVWLDQFTHPAERIWARYFSGDVEGALEDVRAMKPVPEEAFVALALEAGQGKMLAQWAGDEPERWPVVIAGLDFLLDQNWRPKKSVLADVFEAAPPIRRWEAGQQLAAHRDYQLAWELAQGVPGEVPDSQAATASLKLAEWRIALRDAAGARHTLDQALARSPAAVSFAQPYFAALRARWLLTPVSERATFREAELRRLDDRLRDKTMSAMSRALLAALAGDPVGAGEFLAEASPAPQDSKWMESIPESGAQLEQWELHRLARDLYRTVRSRDGALASLRDENFQRLYEANLVQSNLHTASPGFARYLRAEWKARGASPEELLLTARRLLAAGQEQKSAEIVAELCRDNPRNDAMAMGIFSLTPQRRLHGDLSGYVDRVLAAPGSSSLAKNLAVQAGMRLAGMARQDGDYQRELKLLEKLKGDASSTPTIILSRSQALCRLGRPREALELLEKSARVGDSTPYAFALAELYASLGREHEAINMLRRQLGGSPSLRMTAAIRLRELALATNDAEALAASATILESSPRANKAAGESDWPRLLAELDQAHPATVDRFNAGAEFLLAHSRISSLFLQQELRRLDGLVQDQPDLEARYFIFRTALARQRGTLADWERELVTQWKAGSYFAGEILLQLRLEQGRHAELEQVLDQYLTERSFREIAWQQLARDLLKHGQYQLAERVLLTSKSFTDGDADQDLLLAEAIQKQGRSPQELVSRVEELVSVNPVLQLPLARYYLQVGDLATAREHLDRVSSAQAFDTEASAAWGELAEALVKAGRVEEAHPALAEALRRNSPAVAAGLVASYHEAKGELVLTNEFDVPPMEFGRIQAVRLARWQEQNRHDLVLAAFEKNPAMVCLAELRDALQKSEAADWDRVARIWKPLEDEPPIWAVRAAAAQFHARRAAALDKKDDLYLAAVATAQRLDPGNFALTSTLLTELTRRGMTKQANRVLKLAIESFGSATDRAKFRELQRQRSLSPLLES